MPYYEDSDEEDGWGGGGGGKFTKIQYLDDIPAVSSQLLILVFH